MTQSSKSWEVSSEEGRLILIQEMKSGETGQRCIGQHTEVNEVEPGKFLNRMNISLHQDLGEPSMQSLSPKYNVSGVDFIVFG